MILEALIAAQLVGANSELKKQSRLQNKWANNALETLLFDSLINTFVWPFKFGVLVWREGKRAISVFYFVILALVTATLPVLTFFVLYGVSIVLFFINHSEVEQQKSKKPLPPPTPKPKVRSTGKKRTILEVDAETGEIVRTYEEPVPSSS